MQEGNQPSQGDQVNQNREGVFVQGGVSGSTIAGRDVIQNFYQAPTKLDAPALLSKGYALMVSQDYDEASRTFREVLVEQPQSEDAQFYLCLSMFHGTRPRLCRLSAIQDAERRLQALTQMNPQCYHAYALWALIREDFYEMNGLYSPQPSAQELLERVDSLSKRYARDIVEHIRVVDSRVWKWLAGFATGS